MLGRVSWSVSVRTGFRKESLARWEYAPSRARAIGISPHRPVPGAGRGVIRWEVEPRPSGHELARRAGRQDKPRSTKIHFPSGARFSRSSPFGAAFSDFIGKHRKNGTAASYRPVSELRSPLYQYGDQGETETPCARTIEIRENDSESRREHSKSKLEARIPPAAAIRF